MYTPSVSEDGDIVRIKYIAEVDGKKEELEFFIPVYQVGYDASGDHSLDISKFFQSKNADITADKDSVDLSFASDAAVAFINPVLANKFLLSFGAENVSAVRSFTVTLTDYERTSVKADFKFVKVDGWKIVGVNDEFFGIELFGTDDNSIVISEDLTKITVNGQVILMKNLFGEQFNGFPSNKVYLEMSFEAAGPSLISLKRLNNQTLATLAGDTFFPEFYTEQIVGGLYEIGSLYTLKPAYALDVLDTSIETYLTMRTPDFNYAVAIDGTVLNQVPYDREYVIKLNEYGSYSVQYNASVNTFSPQRAGLNFVVTVRDEVAPEIASPIAGSVIKAKVGKKVTFSEMIATDNVSASENLSCYIYIIDPEDFLLLLQEDEFTGEVAYTPEQKGEYRVIYAVYDEAENLALVECKLIVE